jgi:hypothetical protein
LQRRDGAQSSKGVRTRHPPFFRAPVQARRRSLRNSGELAFTPVRLYIFNSVCCKNPLPPDEEIFLIFLLNHDISPGLDSEAEEEEEEEFHNLNC